MKFLETWLKRKKASLCILAGICALSLFAIITPQENKTQNSGGTYAVKIKHYGIDAAEMEKSITIPLEDALSSISGVMSVLSSSENSLSSVYIRFKEGTQGAYEAVRDAVQRVYETLPSSVQRPEIISSNNSIIPVWSAVVTGSSEDSLSEEIKQNVKNEQPQFILEKIVKPRLESLEGAGEVLVSGVGLKEIYITLDQEKLSLLGLNPSIINSVLAMNDSIFSGGSVKQNNRELIITIDGRYEEIYSLQRALIPLGSGKFVELSEIALISEQEREPDILSRLNGKKTAGIAIMGRHGADLRKLSSDIKRELSALSREGLTPLEFTVLSDLGAEEASAFRSVLNAALLGAIMVAAVSFLLNKKNNANTAGFFCAAAIPVICVISAAILTIFGFSFNRILLTGIAAGIGTAIDAVILCSEKLRKCNTIHSASAALSSLSAPLFAGALTTIAAIIPLTGIEDTKIISFAIAVVTITSLILSLTLLPPLLLWETSNKKITNNILTHPFLTKIGKRFSKIFYRLLALAVSISYRNPLYIPAIAVIITISSIIMLIGKGADTGSYGSEDSLYAQVEFEGGLLAQEVDRLLSIYSRQLADIEGIKNVETGARTGSGTLLVSFDPKILKKHKVRETAKNIDIPGGFVFFHENSAKERNWEIFIYGNEDKKCRELARELAEICASHPLIKERVLNFKQGSKKMILLPNREVMAEANISFNTAANMARFGVYGPVAYKRITADGETDVRIRTGSAADYHRYADDSAVTRQSREEALNILVPSGKEEAFSSIHLNSLMKIQDDTEPSSIRRDNRRRFASITISTKPADPRRVKQELSEVIKKINLPPGYSIEFDPEAVKESERLSAAVLSLLTAIIFCYMIIAAINESFTIPLLVLSTVPPSLAFPAICLVLTGSAYNSAVACAFIAVSGMTVNAAVLCVDSIRSSLRAENKNILFTIYSALRKKLPALLATTGTTAAGAIPFLFLTESVNTLIRTLSLVCLLGVTGSCIFSITIIPSLLSLSKKTFKHYNKNPFRLCGI